MMSLAKYSLILKNIDGIILLEFSRQSFLDNRTQGVDTEINQMSKEEVCLTSIQNELTKFLLKWLQL